MKMGQIWNAYAVLPPRGYAQYAYLMGAQWQGLERATPQVNRAGDALSSAHMLRLPFSASP